MTLVDRVNRQRSLTAASRTRRFGRIAANASVPTTTYSYDANGNLLQAGGWSYMWDYLNRMLASGYNNSTTTYAYDPSGARVLQTSTTSTTYYPNKYYSFMSTKIGANTYATSTNYVWNGDTLLATIDQKLYNGAATGSPITRYVHPDHLGSTNVVTDASGTVVQVLDYYPYGAARINSSAGGADQKKKFVGMERDMNGLDYAMARYYDNTRGQFLSEDPVFWEIGITSDGRAVLSDPQLQNSYSWGRDNPVTKKDPDGRCPVCVPIAIGGGIGLIGGIGTQAFNDYLSGDFGRRSFQENLSTYGVAGVSGATVGAGVVVAGAASAAVGLSAGISTLMVGGTAGTLTAGTTVAGDRLLGQQTDYGGLAVNAGLSALTAGTLKTLPGVRGRLPNFGTSAFYTGAHTARQGAEEFFSSSMQSFGQTAYRSAPVFSAGSSGGGSRGSIVQQLQSVVTALQGLVASLSSSGNKK